MLPEEYHFKSYWKRRFEQTKERGRRIIYNSPCANPNASGNWREGIIFNCHDIEGQVTACLALVSRGLRPRTKKIKGLLKSTMKQPERCKENVEINNGNFGPARGRVRFRQLRPRTYT